MRLEDLTLLYAEDEQGIQDTVTEVLDLYVNNVITATNGEEALEFYWQYKPSVLLLDICMPYKDGLSVLREIRKIDIDTPVIIMTAHTEKEYLLNAVELHITKYLVKPFDKNSLLEALNACLELLSKKNDNKINLADNIVFDYSTQTIIKDQEVISLNKKERLLLNLLLKTPNKVLSYDELEYHIWDESISRDALKSLIKDLRKKTSKEIIKNISKAGYKLEIKDV